MANDQQQVKIERTRRSRRSPQADPVTVQAGATPYQETQDRLEEIDTIISDIVTPSAALNSVVLGDGQAHGVRELSSEELVRSFRQQSGE